MSQTKFDIIGQYPNLERDDQGTTDSNMHNIYKIIDVLSKGSGEYPYDPRIWQNWENMQLKTPEIMTKVKIKKPKVNKETKKPIPGEFEETTQRLRKPTTFSATGKDGIKIVLMHLVHEAILAGPALKEKHAAKENDVKNAIIEHARKNLKVNFSSFVYSVCDHVKDDVIMDIFSDEKVGYDHKIQTKLIDAGLKNPNTYNVVVAAFSKLLKLYDNFLAAELFSNSLVSTYKGAIPEPQGDNDAKASKTESSKGASGKATTLKQLLHFIAAYNNLLPDSEKSPDTIYVYLRNATYELIKAQKEKTKNKPKAQKGAPKEKSAKTKGKTTAAKLDIENDVDGSGSDSDGSETGSDAGSGSGSGSGSSSDSGSDSDNDAKENVKETTKKPSQRGKKTDSVETVAAPKRGKAGAKK
jgi:hypothetical protein